MYRPLLFAQYVWPVCAKGALYFVLKNYEYIISQHITCCIIHSLFMIVIACQITGNLNVWMTAPSSTKTLLQQQKHQSTVLLAFCQKGIPLARDLWWKVLPCHKVFVYQDTIAFHWWPPSFSFKLLCILYSTTLITYDIVLHQIWY